MSNWKDETKSSGFSFSPDGPDTGVHLEANICADICKERQLSMCELRLRLLSELPLVTEVRLDAGSLQTMMIWDTSEATQCEEVYKIRPLSGSHMLWAT
jgi:hypothetical protein